MELHQANADSANSSNPYVLAALALKVWCFAHLLWQIAYSDALHNHLGVLSAAKLLSLPRNSSALRKKYADFLQSSSHSPEVDDDDNGDVKDCLEGRDDLPVTFRRWPSLQVSHFAATDIIMTFLVNGILSTITLSLLAVRSPRNVTFAQEKWETTIEQLLSQLAAAAAAASAADRDSIQTLSQKFNAQAAIDLLVQPIEGDNLSWQEGLIVKGFSSSLCTDHSGNTHCEAALVTLKKYVDGMGLNIDLERLLRERYLVSVLLFAD